MYLCGKCNNQYVSKMAAEACCNFKGGTKLYTRTRFLSDLMTTRHKLDIE